MEKYEKLELEVIQFSCEDVIVTSTGSDNQTDEWGGGTNPNGG